ncbi:hypothetical protein [Tenacibaculum jejuense]|uniref:Uncharacterized protein n=1 Tax=Tenacibaculum jejuense TaxID=584609 RepID=A0A238U6V4_9FLAO|nr:hypothetical protein [Tenacibaculum jejuense]SNR14929.1 protein of unknown function [Tenacibaculum jejuense]
MSKTLNIVFLILFIQITKAQNLNINDNMYSTKNLYDIDNMVDHFEGIICNKYNIDKSDSHLAYKKYVNALNDNLNFIKAKSPEKTYINQNTLKDLFYNNTLDSTYITKKTIELLLTSHRKLKNYVWIKNKENRARKGFKSLSELDSSVIKKMNTVTLNWYKEQEKNNSNLVLNHFDKFSEKLILETNHKDITDLIITFREEPDHSPQTIAYALIDLKENDFKNQAIKTFVAFELYYAYINSHISYE